ncbi:MAG TPA: nuclear transport factor 2 family protein, partial [Mycobacteriales bacterium]|nr:nuclear transport factor 2 family protein [Mycobacteriales bacterium]
HLGEQPVRGRQAIRDRFAELFEQWPSFGFDTYRVRVGDRHWVLDWALTAELTGPDRTRRPVRFDCIDLVEIDDNGLVTRKDTFVDLVQAQQALAATP